MEKHRAAFCGCNVSFCFYPARKSSLSSFSPLVDGQSQEEALNNQNRITTEFIPELKQLTSGSGSYHNEVGMLLLASHRWLTVILQADFQDPDFKEAFWGANYNKLLAIKDKWDPDQLLYGSINVGGDRWTETQEGRLCKV